MTQETGGAWGNALGSSKPKPKGATLGKVTNTDGSQYKDGKQVGEAKKHGHGARGHGWIQVKPAAETSLPAQIPGLQKLLCDKGWPEMAIINVTGIGKTGKTTFALQEAILQAAEGKRVLYIYNESPRPRFMAIANAHREELGIPIDKLKTMRFLDLTDVTLRAPKPESIERFVQTFVLKEIGVALKTGNPDLVVIDSLTSLCRLWPAQAYYFARCFTRGLWDKMEMLDVKPCVLCINQKSGGHWEANDATVLGGHGVVHEMDGSIVFTRKVTDHWDAERFGHKYGSTVRYLRFESLRDLDVDDSEHQLIKDRGKLWIGDTPDELKTKVEAKSKKAKSKSKGSKDD